MKKFVMIVACAAALGAAPAYASSSETLTRAEKVVQDGCKVSRSGSRVTGACRTKEAAEALKKQFKDMAGTLTVFGPLCSFVPGTQQVVSCDVQLEPTVAG